MGITRGLRKTWPTKSKESQGLCGTRKGNEINLSSSRSLNQLLCLIATRMRPVVKLNSNPRTSLHFVPVRGIPSENTWPNCVIPYIAYVSKFHGPCAPASLFPHPHPSLNQTFPTDTQIYVNITCIKRIGNS